MSPQASDGQRPHPRPAAGHDRRAQMDRLLFARRDAGDRRARDELIMRFLPLARSVARRYEHSGEPLEDLVQVASLALVKAIDRYDTSRGSAFSSYAVPSIVGELKRHFRDRGWAVRPPRDLQELIIRLDRVRSELTATLDRAPTVAELGAEIGAGEEEILEALQARGGRGALSLQATTTRASGESVVLQDLLRSYECGFAQAEARAVLDGLLRGLPRRSRVVLRLRFEQDLTQAEIGALLGVSQMQISRIVRGALEQLAEVAAQHERIVTQRAESLAAV